MSPGESKERKLKIIASFGLVYKLRPSVDGERMLRVGGQLQNSSFDYQLKHQLPLMHHIANLLVMEVHESVGHLGQEYVLASLRQKYWIVKGRANV